MPRWSCPPEIMTTRWLPCCRLTHTDVCQETPSQPSNARSPTSSGLSTSLKPSTHQRTVISSPLHPPAHVSLVNPRFTSRCSSPPYRGVQGFPNIQHSQTHHQDPPPTARPHTASHHQLKSVRPHHQGPQTQSIWPSCQFWRSLPVHQHTNQRSMPHRPRTSPSWPCHHRPHKCYSRTSPRTTPHMCFVIMLQVVWAFKPVPLHFCKCFHTL